MQHLNLSVFRAIKVLYQRAIRKINVGNTDKILRYQSIQRYMDIRPAVMSESNILSECRKSGICPLNRLIPLSSHFVKNLAARNRLELIISDLNTSVLPVVMQNNAELSERD